MKHKKDCAFLQDGYATHCDCAPDATYTVEYQSNPYRYGQDDIYRRATFTAPENASSRMLVRRAKKALNLSEWPCDWPIRTEVWGNRLVLCPKDGAAVIAFIFVTDDEEETV